ncbi:hypothetical protein GETHLI_05540 [Geothrix limicola]|uniref:Uncharacterized protein n=1 Tax=Geothrix limicola TaxID=2927978 RepID=A0ABQ5QB53_9BACT|nr:hypothetical protein GETHLI_05540 [Geothrix limicola]
MQTQISAPIVVHVSNTGGATVSADNAGAASRDLVKMFEPVMNDWAVKQKRPGGMLA